MGGPLSDGVKIAIVMVICCAVVAIIITIAAMAYSWNNDVQQQLSEDVYLDHLSTFTSMAVYGEAIPMTNVVAALDLYGTPEVLCVQMEDLKGQMGGTPYPVAYNNEARMKELLQVLHNYYEKEVYVYVATPNGQLQLCVSELPHSSNPDGSGQDWEVD